MRYLLPLLLVSYMGLAQDRNQLKIDFGPTGQEKQGDWITWSQWDDTPVDFSKRFYSYFDVPDFLIAFASSTEFQLENLSPVTGTSLNGVLCDGLRTNGQYFHILFQDLPKGRYRAITYHHEKLDITPVPFMSGVYDGERATEWNHNYQSPSQGSEPEEVIAITTEFVADGIRPNLLTFYQHNNPNHIINGMELTYLDGPSPQQRAEFLRVYNDVVPFDSMESGYAENHAPLYLCIGNGDDNLYVGNYRSPWQGCAVVVGGQAVLMEDFRLLKDRSRFFWAPQGNPMVLGKNRDGSLLYGCRGEFYGIRSGTFDPATGECQVANFSNNATLGTFEILME